MNTTPFATRGSKRSVQPVQASTQDMSAVMLEIVSNVPSMNALVMKALKEDFVKFHVS